MSYTANARWLLASIFVLASCAAEYDVRLRASEALLEGSVNAEVAIVANCLSQATAGPVRGDPHLFYRLGEPVPSLGSVPAGNHGLFARFTDDECNLRAVGCQDVEIEDGGDATLVVAMSAATGSACDANERCVSGRCEPGLADAAVVPDAMSDASVRDAGERDAGVRDAGVRDAGARDSSSPMDASPFDSFSPDAVLRDAGLDAMDPCGSTSLLCDDFEGPTFGYARGVSEGSTVELTREQAHSGVQSVLVHAAGGTDSASFLTIPFDDTQDGERWVRVWFLLPSSHEGLAPLSLESGENAVSLYSSGGSYTGLDTYLFPGGDTSAESTIPLPLGRWTCVEVQLSFDQIVSARLFIDGERTAQLSVPLPNAFPMVRFGATYRDPADPVDYDIYVDDIAMSTERIGCD